MSVWMYGWVVWMGQLTVGAMPRCEVVAAGGVGVASNGPHDRLQDQNDQRSHDQNTASSWRDADCWRGITVAVR